MKKAILSISHSNYMDNVGGLEKVILEQYNVARGKDYDFIAIYPILKNISIKGHVVKHRFQRFGVLFNDEKPIFMNLQELQSFVKKIFIEKVFIHSLMNIPINKALLLLDVMPEASLFFYVHDYGSVCDGHNLLKNKSRYCGPDGIHSSKCFNCRFFIPGILSIQQYNKFFDHFSRIKFIFPSEVARDIWRNSYPNISKDRLIVLPHQKLSIETRSYKRNTKLKLAYIGYKSFNKGWRTFRNLVSLINEKKLNIELYVLGKTDEHLPNVKEIEVSFQKDGVEAMTSAIRNNCIDIAFLWSPWPETYSYTFFESFIGGAFIITNKDSGNIAAKTMELDCGKVFNDEQELLRFFESNENLEKISHYTPVRPLKLTFNSEFINL